MATPTTKTSWLGTFANGLLYICSSLVLGIQLNLLGPSASSLAHALGVTEGDLGPGRRMELFLGVLPVGPRHHGQ